MVWLSVLPSSGAVIFDLWSCAEWGAGDEGKGGKKNTKMGNYLWGIGVNRVFTAVLETGQPGVRRGVRGRQAGAPDEGMWKGSRLKLNNP